MGREAGQWSYLGGFYTAPAMITEFIHLFVATDLRPSAVEPVPEEEIEVVRVPLSHLPRLIDRVRDARRSWASSGWPGRSASERLRRGGTRLRRSAADRTVVGKQFLYSRPVPDFGEYGSLMASGNATCWRGESTGFRYGRRRWRPPPHERPNPSSATAARRLAAAGRGSWSSGTPRRHASCSATSRSPRVQRRGDRPERRGRRLHAGAGAAAHPREGAHDTANRPLGSGPTDWARLMVVAASVLWVANLLMQWRGFDAEHLHLRPGWLMLGPAGSPAG